MPSVKSYQNRKHEIELLKRQLAEGAQELEKVKLEYIMSLRDKNVEISKLSKDLQATKCQRDLDHISLELVQTADSKMFDALRNKINELERKVRIYRDYIRHGEAYYPEHYTVTIPPSCLKPLDALK